jgi:hypothetical protein
MLTHPYITQRLAAEHGRELFDTAARHRLSRAAAARQSQRTPPHGVTHAPKNLAIRLGPLAVLRGLILHYPSTRRSALSEGTPCGFSVGQVADHMSPGAAALRPK